MNNTKDILNPPGTILIWGVVILELVMFAALLLIVNVYKYNNPEEFLVASSKLYIIDGVIYTATLLVSGFLAAEGVRTFYERNKNQSLGYFFLAAILGMTFLVLKWFDFANKSQSGLNIETNNFWQYYWLLMGFHFLHVLIGEVILISIIFNLYKDRFDDPEFSVKGGTLFWHMCDLAWLFIFPTYYIVGNIR